MLDVGLDVGTSNHGLDTKSSILDQALGGNTDLRCQFSSGREDEHACGGLGGKSGSVEEVVDGWNEES